MLELNKERNRKILLTAITSLLLQFISIVVGFILPKLYLKYWGSEVNGLISSVTQFLGLISFLDMGVGTVIQSNLYKPLEENDIEEVSRVLVSGRRFFRMIALILALYALGIAFFYPVFVSTSVDYLYCFILVLIIAFDSFAQYYFGITYQILLNADQKAYVQNIIVIVTLLINTIVCYILIINNYSFVFVKFFSMLVYLLRPIILYLYIKNKYNRLNLDIKCNKETIKQKWDGFWQHLFNVILGNIDVVILSICSTLDKVSVYSIYSMILNGVMKIINSTIAGFPAVYGNLYAKKDKNELNYFFNKSEWLIHTFTIIVFGCTLSLILPFVKVYTKGINDTNYEIESFAYFITIAFSFYSLRFPYHAMVTSAIKFKETKSIYLVPAAINVVSSLILYRFFNITGVALGTLLSMFIQTVWLARYTYKNIIDSNFDIFIKQLFLDIILFIIFFGLKNIYTIETLNYVYWLILAIKYVITYLIISFIFNLIVYKNNIIYYINKISMRIKKK